MKTMLQSAARMFGVELSRYRPPSKGPYFPSDIADDDKAVMSRVAGFTMTSVERQVALIQAVRYIVSRGIDGCFVECGVWRGGSSMAIALTLLQEDQRNRDLYLFDTFEGMTPPLEIDKAPDGKSAQEHMDADVDKTGVWCVAGLDDVQQNMQSTGYAQDRIHLIKGPVEATIPASAPTSPIALLRLDTDWYESTKHELLHLFPLLAGGGVLIIDDYGHWEGARKAVDEFLASLPARPYLHRIDDTGRLLVKY